MVLGKTLGQHGFDIADTIGHDTPSYVATYIGGGLLDDALKAGNAGNYIDDAIEGAGERIIGTTHNTFMPTQEVVNPQKVAEYSKRLKVGEKIPPVQVIDVPGRGRYIIDGHHRYVASRQTGIPVEIKVMQGQGPVGMPDWINTQWRDYINEDQFWGN